MAMFYDRITQFNNRVKLKQNSDGTYTLEKVEGTVYQEGTKLDAINLNLILNSIVPEGTIWEYAGDTAPQGFLFCRGQTVSRTQYKALFDVIGTTYGSGDGSTTFNLPDLRGKVPVGYKEGDTNFGTLGGSTGATTSSHNHTSGTLVADIGAVADNLSTIGYNATNAVKTAYNRGISGNAMSDIASQSVNHATTVSGNTADGSTSTLQPSTVVNFIIKYKTCNYTEFLESESTQTLLTNLLNANAAAEDNISAVNEANETATTGVTLLTNLTNSINEVKADMQTQTQAITEANTQNNATVATVTAQSNAIQTLAEENQAKIDSATIATKADINLVNSSLEEKVNKDKLGFYIVDELPDFDINDVSICINKALEDNKPIKLLDKKYFIKSPILLRSGSRITGCGSESIIRITNGYGIEALKNYDSRVSKVELYNFDIAGNLLSTPDVEEKTILSLINDDDFGPEHRIENIHIYNVVGMGVHLKGGGTTYATNLRVTNSTNIGIKIETVDSWYTNLDAGVCGENAFYLSGNNNSYVTCRGWQSDDVYVLKGSRNMMVDCQAQDCLKTGFIIEGWDNKYELLVDTVGTKNTGETYSDSCGIKLLSDSGRNIIGGIIGDRLGYVEEGTLSYVLDIDSNSTNNDINLKCYNIKVNPLKNSVYKNTNKIHIRGSYIDHTPILIDSDSISDKAITEAAIITSSERNCITREKNICSLYYIVSSESFSSGSIIGNVGNDMIPILYSGLNAFCYNSNDSLIGIAMADISSDNGDITLWYVPESTVKVNVFGVYVAKNKI